MKDILNYLQMEDDLIFFTNGRRPKFLGNGRRLKSLENGRQAQYCSKWKTTSILKPMEDHLNIFQMKDDLNHLENGR